MWRRVSLVLVCVSLPRGHTVPSLVQHSGVVLGQPNLGKLGKRRRETMLARNPMCREESAQASRRPICLEPVYQCFGGWQAQIGLVVDAGADLTRCADFGLTSGRPMNTPVSPRLALPSNAGQFSVGGIRFLLD